MQKIINNPGDFVDEVLDGILLAHGTRWHAVGSDMRALVRADAPAPGRVGIVTGGGSGHLPFFLGYVGPGLCSAVAIGNVFSSPSPAQIYAASTAVSSGAGLLYLYGNYGGDVYNFDLAADLCRADGIEIRTVVGTDDIESAPADESDRRRGVAGLVLVYKAAGAAAERLYPLDEVERIARKAVAATRTMGVGLAPTILPAAGEPTFALDDGEMEIGVGIHGERGTHRGPLETADEIAERFLARIGQELALSVGTRVAVLVNGLGATPLEELYVLYRRIHRALVGRGAAIEYVLVGEYVTSLEMAGASVSIMRLDDELAELMGAPASTPFFHGDQAGRPGPAAAIDTSAPAAAAIPVGRMTVPSRLLPVLLAALPRVAAHRDELRDLDATLGDGDLGITITAGCDAAVRVLAGLPADVDARTAVAQAGLAFSTANPSTFAALLGGGLIRGAQGLEPGQDLTVDAVGRLLADVTAAVAARGGAQLGDKTMLDVLDAVSRAVRDGRPAEQIRTVAAETVAATTALRSRRGRAAWQRDRSIGQADPGSVAVWRFVDEIVASLPDPPSAGTGTRC